MIQILPSILAADFARLAEEIHRVEQGGASLLHVDVMDGHFVPNITIGPVVVEAIRKVTRMTLDVHLMIADADRYAPAFIDAGANQLSVHQEACPHLNRTLREIRSQGVAAGVVLNPATPVSLLEATLEEADFVLLMSVNPGFGGQQFIPGVLDKVRRLERMRREQGLDFAIEIDGGINKQNLPEVVRAGCDWIVAGSSIFQSPDPGAAVAEMRQIAAESLAVRV